MYINYPANIQIFLKVDFSKKIIFDLFPKVVLIIGMRMSDVTPATMVLSLNNFTMRLHKNCIHQVI